MKMIVDKQFDNKQKDRQRSLFGNKKNKYPDADSVGKKGLFQQERLFQQELLIPPVNENTKIGARKNFGIFRNYLEYYPTKVLEYCWYGINNIKIPADLLAVLNPDEIVSLYVGVWKVKFILNRNQNEGFDKPFFNYLFDWCMKKGNETFEKYKVNLSGIMYKDIDKYLPEKQEIGKRLSRVDYTTKIEFINQLKTPLKIPRYKTEGNFYIVSFWIKEKSKRQKYAAKIYSFFEREY